MAETTAGHETRPDSLGETAVGAPSARAATGKGSELRKEIALACRVLQREGQADLVWGHVGARDPDGRGVWLKGSNLGFDEVTAEDVILLSWDGEVLEGTGGRHVEYHIHLEIMRQRPDVHGVVHTHPLYSIAFAATGWPLKALSHDGAFFVPPDIARFNETDHIIGTRELGESLAASLGDRNAILMPRHGITVVGGSVGEAVASATHLERACHLALLAGKDAIPSPDAEALEKQKRIHRRMASAWAYLARTTARSD